ncbi:MAG: putative PEP-binding protein [Candidatus Paceibacterota bacterium]
MRMASAIVTESGSRTCHAAIVGRELGLPTIVGAYNATKLIKDKQMVTVVCSEGEKGIVYDGNLNFTINRTDLSKLTKPKVKITMNIGDPNQAFLNSFIPNDGVGLAREEFIVANHIKIHPMALIEYKKQDAKIKKQIDEITFGYTDKSQFYVDKLAEGIGKIASAFYPKEVILRFSDFKTNEYKNLIGGLNYELNEENPMIGFRGASRYYHSSFKPAFDLELKAIKKVINDFGLTNLSLMIPFCRTISEGEKVVKLIKSTDIEKPKIYVMCEIPSNVILADKFLDIFDGMSIGSNDLTQLVLGIDRDANHLIQNIANENDESVKELIKMVIKKCKDRNKYIGICGQAPSDYPKFAQFLVDDHIDSMSLNPDSVLKIRKFLG